MTRLFFLSKHQLLRVLQRLFRTCTCRHNFTRCGFESSVSVEASCWNKSNQLFGAVFLRTLYYYFGQKFEKMLEEAHQKFHSESLNRIQTSHCQYEALVDSCKHSAHYASGAASEAFQVIITLRWYRRLSSFTRNLGQLFEKYFQLNPDETDNDKSSCDFEKSSCDFECRW